jgi:bacterioferritin (cytochrome b1)
MNETKKKLAKVRPYYKYEIAELFKIDKRMLSDWLEDILDTLEETGYRKTQQLFTLKQTEIIFAYLGHPNANNERDIQTGEKVPVVPYTKSELAAMYDISSSTLMKLIDAIPYERARLKILTGNENHTGKINRNKRLFKNYEVKLIFYFLGHPYSDV